MTSSLISTVHNSPRLRFLRLRGLGQPFLSLPSLHKDSDATIGGQLGFEASNLADSELVHARVVRIVHAAAP